MKRKGALTVIVAVFVILGGGIGSYYWYQGANYVSTEDARIAGDIYKVMPKISAKILSLHVKEGDTVMADQIIGQQDTSNLPNNQLNNASLLSPIQGVVIKMLFKEGEVASPGQTVAMIIDESKLYVSANIEETDIHKVKLGQKVDIKVDAYPGVTLTGRVIEIGEATNSTFSLIPSTNTSGTFNKVTQRIPIEVSIDSYEGLPIIAGMNTQIKIHLKGN